MEFPTFISFYCLLTVLLLLPALHKCDQLSYYMYSRATYYGSPDCLGTATGACGFGEYGRTVNYGKVAGVSRLYKNGTGCGACYQVRCKIPQLCTEEGTYVVVTDYGEGDRTDFVLSARAYTSMAKTGLAAQLVAYGTVDIEYQRVPCRFPGYNLKLKVHEHSRFSEYLAVVVIYQAGFYDVTAVEIWREDCKQWIGMRRAYGAVFDMPNPPTDELSFRLQVSGGAEVKYVQLNGVIPRVWKAGVAYDTAVQLD